MSSPPSVCGMWLRPVVRSLVLVACASGTHLSARDYVWPERTVFSQERLQGSAYQTGHPSPAPADSWSGAPPSLMDRITGIARGRTQLEGGYTFLCDKTSAGRMTQHAVPDLLLRFGLNDRLEIRLGWPGYVATEHDGLAGGSSGETLEPNVGLMLDLWSQRGILPQTALLAAVPITLEGNPFALHGLQPLSQLLYRWHLTERFALGGTTGIALFDVQGDHFVELQQTATLDWVLTGRLGTFAEWEMLVDHGSADDGSQHMLGGGLWCLLTERLQVTWRAGSGLNGRAPDFLTDVRFAYRF